MKRRNFIRNIGIAGVGLPLIPNNLSFDLSGNKNIPVHSPVSITTWNFQEANRTAGELLQKGISALDAVEQGVRIEESNIKNHTVGKGGAPDRDGKVTLDAIIMAPNGNFGSVAFLENIEHPVSVARKVMEETPHNMLVGEGAYQFALSQGFEPENLLTEESEKQWKNWLVEKEYKPIINIENHDTIGMLCLDSKGDIAGACTTSGLAYKMRGRVGDSPIIGSGLFIDNEVGGAVATGLGEEILKNVSTFLIVELMRSGKSPQEACEIAVERIVKKPTDLKDFQVAFLALNKNGEVGSYCIHPGFSYALHSKGDEEAVQSKSYLAEK
ncbi:N(4)-(beta-N-acetylglucosaminyl)-L-asparaginase [Antarcticibacterium sp. 1MA-6-2]|uniref:N(4)-(beta-N-acetylglucosaminyl)-L-asparaginase n=1 Tax=Antarcticibacterium sp. 1MA-6-2 TaxID=2908210 RepID=UPI001F269CDC|nr:N(4)-(beta-N-acetylglucosaminyl)-L-asparaginase [Antarcticibacterium sp. 1MA-6-2]UJH90736.1 N(4)-(beta-N-acetylglucosaminyl)-L-asparaginase [Antarcticibacterium sp. 1MA-6-2]